MDSLPIPEWIIKMSIDKINNPGYQTIITYIILHLSIVFLIESKEQQENWREQCEIQRKSHRIIRIPSRINSKQAKNHNRKKYQLFHV